MRICTRQFNFKVFLIELKSLKKNFFDIFNLIKTVSLIKFLFID